MSLLGSLLNVGGLTASAYLPYEQAGTAIEDLKSSVAEVPGQISGLQQQATAGSQFTPFTVRTGTGTGMFDQYGGLNLNLSPEQQAMQSALFGQAQQAAQQGIDPAQYNALQQQALYQAQQQLQTGAPTASELFSQMQQSMAGENERTRLALENRLAGQGRLGVQTAAFGGTPEALAMEKAMQEQQSRNWLNAQQLAPQLQAQNTQNAAGLFGLGAQAGATPYSLEQARLGNITSGMQAGFLPEQQMLTALSPSLSLQGALTQRDLGNMQALTQLGMAGIESQAGGLASISNVESARTQALADTLSGLFKSTAGAESPIDTLIAQLLGG
jgi:hypothetical protein